VAYCLFSNIIFGQQTFISWGSQKFVVNPNNKENLLFGDFNAIQI